MRKKIILAAGLLLASVVSLKAQSSITLRINQLNTASFDFKPFVTDETYDFKLKGTALSGDVLGMFSLASGKMIRFGAGYTYLALHGKGSDNWPDATENVSGTLKQSSIFIAPGIAANLNQNDKYRFYAGLDIPFTIIGKTSFNGEDQYIDKTGFYDSYTDKVEGQADGGMSIGLSPLLGFRYKIAGPLYLGAELASGLKFTSVGSNMSMTYYEDGVASDQETADGKITNFGLMPVKMSLTLSYSFGKAKE